MHPSIKKQIMRQHIRRTHGLLIKEEATLYSTFVQPFTDVVSAVKLGSQELLSITKLAWDTITLSPKKMNEAREKFDARQAKISEKWKPIMDRNRAALKRGDADFLALVFAPGGTMAANATATAVAAAGGTIGYLNDAGWKLPLLSSIGDFKLDATTTTDSGSSGATSGKEEKSLLGKLASLFYIEHSWLPGELILEQENQKPSGGDFKKELDEWLVSTGVAAEFEKSAMEMIESAKDLLKEPVEEAISIVSALKSLKNTSTPEDFASSLSALSDLNIDGLDPSVNPNEIKKKISDAAEKLIGSEDFLETAKKIDPSLGDLKDITEDKKKAIATKVATLQLKKGFDDKAQETIDKIKNQALEFIEKNIPDEQNTSALSGTKLGVEYLKVFKDSKLSIENL